MLVISCKRKLLITLIGTIDMKLNANIILCNFLVDIIFHKKIKYDYS